MLDQFANGVGNAFHAYKLNSSINRTLLNCNFKQKEMTSAQIKIKKIIDEERLNILQISKDKNKGLNNGEKNFWRKNGIKQRNQSVSLNAIEDLDEDCTESAEKLRENATTDYAGLSNQHQNDQSEKNLHNIFTTQKFINEESS